LISPEGKDKIAAYIQSFEDLIGEQVGYLLQDMIRAGKEG